MCGWGRSWCHQHGNGSEHLHRAELGDGCWCDLFDFVTELSRNGCNCWGPIHLGGPCGRRVRPLCMMDHGPPALFFLQGHTVRCFWFHRHCKCYKVFLEVESWGKQKLNFTIVPVAHSQSPCWGASIRAAFHLVEWFSCMLREDIVQP